MWEYNYDYLCHGIKGHKYIDRKMGKNGKWIYTYPGERGHRTPLRTETGAKMKFLPLLTPEMVSFDLHTKEVLAHPENHNWDNKGYWAGVKKDYQLREESKKENTKPTTNLGKEPLKKSPAPKPEDDPEVAKAVGALIGNAAKDLNSKITGAVKNSKIYKETLGDEDFKKYKEYKPKRNDILRNLRDTIWNAARAKNDQERQQNIAALKQMLNTAESKYGSTAAKEIWKEYEETIDKYYGFATDAADKYELESSYKALNDFKNVDREVKNQKIGTTEAGFDAEMERWVQRSKKKK